MLGPDGRAAHLCYARPVVIGNDVWLGANVVVTGGVTIGDGCVIGAGERGHARQSPPLLAGSGRALSGDPSDHGEGQHALPSRAFGRLRPYGRMNDDRPEATVPPGDFECTGRDSAGFFIRRLEPGEDHASGVSEHVVTTAVTVCARHNGGRFPPRSWCRRPGKRPPGPAPCLRARSARSVPRRP